MTLEEVKQFFAANKDNAEVKAYVATLNPAQVTLETVRGFCENTPEGKVYMQQSADAKINKAVDKFRDETLPGLVDQEVKKRFPDKTPEQKELAELKAKIEKTESEAKKEKLLNRALTICTEKGIPAKLANLLVGADEELTTANITLVETVFTEHVTTEVEKRLKLGGREGKPGSEGKPGEYTGPNPWKKETFNLTLQGKLLTENPELAKSLQAQAK